MTRNNKFRKGDVIDILDKSGTLLSVELIEDKNPPAKTSEELAGEKIDQVKKRTA